MKSKEKARAGEVGTFSNHAEDRRQRVAGKVGSHLSYLVTQLP